VNFLRRLALQGGKKKKNLTAFVSLFFK